MDEGQHIVEQVDRTANMTGAKIKAVTADAGCAYGKVYGALEDRQINAVIPANSLPYPQLGRVIGLDFGGAQLQGLSSPGPIWS